MIEAKLIYVCLVRMQKGGRLSEKGVVLNPLHLLILLPTFLLLTDCALLLLIDVLSSSLLSVQ